MHDYLLAVLLGIIEGITEFLPISSTAHLRIAQYLLGLNLEDEYWKMFSVVIQLGAILSVLVYFKKRILFFIDSFKKSAKKISHPLSLVFIAFVVTAIPAFLLSKVIGENLESLKIIGWSLLLGGFVMWFVDSYFKNPKTLAMEQMTIFQSVGIGLIQILSAVFPGVSRSMSTIAAGQILGLSRASALEFSFFVSIPTMIAATFYDLLKNLSQGNGVLSTSQQWITLVIGFFVSFVTAYLVIAWFMNWVKTKGFFIFAVYRIILGLLILVYLV